MIKTFTFILCLLGSVSTAAEHSWVVSAQGMKVWFQSFQSNEAKAKTRGVLVLVPGYNGLGQEMLDARWKTFAEKNQLVLLAPTFQAEGNENNQGKGYYYPEQGSGEVMEKALRELKRLTGANTDKVLFFGFSAGAHFSHRFALWKPQRVKAFVAYSAAWWSEPTEVVRNVPALIMCGEADDRYAATYEFFRKGHKLGCPWLWRSYDDTEHVLTPTVRAMAESFLTHYMHSSNVKPELPSYGDIQTLLTQKKPENRLLRICASISLVLKSREFGENRRSNHESGNAD